MKFSSFFSKSNKSEIYNTFFLIIFFYLLERINQANEVIIFILIKA